MSGCSHFEPIEPDVRFELGGGFDSESYEQDRELFPDLFDENGWPLFGHYDPYASFHPITGRPWYVSPRVPHRHESGTEYEAAYGLALEFETLWWQIFGQFTKISGTVRYLEPETEAGVMPVYAPNAAFAVKGNIIYVRNELIPQLEFLFLHRQWGARFSTLWGEFRGIVEGFGFALRAGANKQARSPGGAKHDRSAQLKFYLHFRRYHLAQGWTVPRVNRTFIGLARDVAKGKLAAPVGFDSAFFDKAAPINHGRCNLSRALKHAMKDPRYQKLLDSPPDQAPRIPPLLPAQFRL